MPKTPIEHSNVSPHHSLISTNASIRNTTLRERIGQCTEVLVLAAIFAAMVWEIPPHVNEAHYLTKAKHFWDRTFCANDIFVTSHEAHWFFYLTHGWFCRFLEFETVAWVGRVVAWLVTAWGLLKLSRLFWPQRWLPVLIAGAVVALNLWLNLAGEWFVGGVEGKCYAYGFAFAGFASWLERRYLGAAIFLALACAFHIVVGLWFMISIGFAIAFEWLGGLGNSMSDGNQETTKAVRSSRKPLWLVGLGLIAAISLFVIGFWPAASQNQGVLAEDVVAASRAQSLWRLAHHQYAVEFKRWIFFLPLLVSWLILWRASNSQHQQRRKLLRLNLVTFGAVLIAFCGVVASYFIFANPQGFISDFCARLLTLYLFRLADVLVPLATVINAAVLLRSFPVSFQPARIAITASVVFIAFTIAAHFLEVRHDPRTPSSRQAVTTPNSSELLRREIEAERNWIKTCRWIRANTPADAVFITPANQQTFKWYAHRAEAACRKDMPQNAKGVLLWLERLELLYEGLAGRLVDPQEQIRDLGDPWLKAMSPLSFGDRLPLIADLVDADFLVVEQRVFDFYINYLPPPKGLNQIYPVVGERKSTYAVFEIGDSGIASD